MTPSSSSAVPRFIFWQHNLHMPSIKDLEARPLSLAQANLLSFLHAGLFLKPYLGLLPSMSRHSDEPHTVIPTVPRPHNCQGPSHISFTTTTLSGILGHFYHVAILTAHLALTSPKLSPSHLQRFCFFSIILCSGHSLTAFGSLGIQETVFLPIQLINL